MKISLKQYQIKRYHYFITEVVEKDWREGIWWTGSPTSLIGFYGMKDGTAKRQLKLDTYEVQTPLGLRFIGKQRLTRLFPLFIRREAEGIFRGDPIYEAIKREGTLSHNDLTNLGFQSKKVTSVLSDLRRDWIVVTEHKGKETIFHHWTEFLEETQNHENLEVILHDLFNVFGYMTLDGISLFLGIRPYYFVNTLTALERDGILYRPFKISDNKKDVFALKEEIPSENFDLPIREMVLEDTDALASLLFYEEGRPLGNRAVFIKDGQPIAFFKLKLKRKEISVSDFFWTSSSIDEVQRGIKSWGERHGYKAQIDYRNSSMGKITIYAIQTLLEKGYKLEGEYLELKKGKEIVNSPVSGIDRNKCFSWLFLNQLKPFKSEEEIIRNIIQLNSLDCITLRLGRIPNLDGIEAVLGRGGNGRLGIMLPTTFCAFSNLDTKEIDFTIADQRILKLLESFPGISASELSSQLNLSYPKVIQRIRFLEKRYRIFRLGLNAFDENSANWAINPYFGTMEESEAENFLVSKLLQDQLPLTTTMISRYFGWHFSRIEKVLSRLEADGMVKRGHFVQYPDDEIQFGWNGRIKEIKNTEIITDGLFFIPFEDPISIIYFPMLIQLYPSLQPRSLEEFENGFMIFKGSIPIGYISKSTVNYVGPSSRRVRYIANLRVLNEWLVKEELIFIFDKFINNYYDIWGIWGAVGEVNGKSLVKIFGEEIQTEFEMRGLDTEFI